MRLFLGVSDYGFTTILYARIFQMSFHVRSGEVGFFCDDAGDSSKMRLEGRFSGGIFIVFMICWMPYGLLFAACMIFVQ